jgi:predicted enzyme related to lactoylglutathione lyase
MAKGEITHIEFPADDVERAKRFYSAVAGWEISPVEGMPGYLMFRTSENHGGGLGTRGDTVGEEIRIYITVDSLETAIAAAEANGGSTVTAPSEVPGMGRYAVILDSEGSKVGLWENAPS